MSASMLLLIDAGNTRIKWALADARAAPGDWVASGAVAHAALGQLAHDWGRYAVARAIVANVAGAALRAQLAPMIPTAAIDWFAAVAQLGGLRNGYREPSQLGADRFAAALGARALAPGAALIVATCGTATTIDALSADGLFVGGMILPGLGLMAGALARGTAQLPWIAGAASGAALPSGFADNTDDAIAAGCLAAQAGAIERACAQHHADLCIVSGGAAPFIAPQLTCVHRMVDNLVLIGLHASATMRKLPC